jgi:hypothetical protein
LGKQRGGAVKRKSRKQGGHRCARLPLVRLLLEDGSGFAVGGAPPGASVLLVLFPPSPSPLACGGVDRGMESTEAARIWSTGWRGGALLIAMGGGGRVNGADVRTGARSHRDDVPSLARWRSAHRRH